MRKGIKVALDPTPRQEQALWSHAGAARFAFNIALLHIQSQLSGCTPVQGKGRADWSMPALRRWWNEWKREIAPWWNENSKEAYNTGLQSLSDAFSNYFDSRSGTRKGRRMGWPRPRKRSKTTPRFTYTTGSFGVADDHGLKLPRIGRVHCMENVRRLVGDARITRMTIRHEGGRWYASLSVECDEPQPAANLKGSIGIDLGVRTFATLSDGTMIANPHRMKLIARKQRRLSRRLSRRHKGSKRWVEAKRENSKLANRAANQRRDMLDKTTTMLAATYRDISIEDLNVKGMSRRNKPKEDPGRPGEYLPNGRARKSGLNREILDQGFGMFRRMLEYKCARTGARLHVIDRWYPSSKTCSGCGTVKTKLSLNTRTYVCHTCGLVMDRDLNAAINIQVAGSAPETLNARGGNTRRTPGAHSPNETRTKQPHPKGMRLGANTRKSVLQAKTN